MASKSTKYYGLPLPQDQDIFDAKDISDAHVKIDQVLHDGIPLPDLRDDGFIYINDVNTNRRWQPKAGVDYYTPEEKQEILDFAAQKAAELKTDALTEIEKIRSSAEDNLRTATAEVTAAKEAAEKAENNANEAVTKAQAAQTAAENAEAAATDAQSGANAAKEAAEQSASAAGESKNKAQKIADSLQGTVDQANTAADRANEAAAAAEHIASHAAATKTSKGIVQIGEGINVTPEGVISSTDTITRINGKTGDIEKADIVALDIPEQDTTYNAATISEDGLMSATDKKKLDEIAERANNYTLPTASAQNLGGIKVGKNLSIAEDGTLNATDTTYNPATTSSSGLMSAADKTAVDGIGNASEAPSVTDKSSVWAAINEAASKGGGISMDTVRVAEALREKHVTVPANLEELDVPAAIRSINESHFGLWLANTMDTGTDGEKIAAVEHLDVPDYARSLDGMYGVSLDDRMVRTLYAYPRSWNAAVASPGTMTVLAASSTAMNAVAASSTAMNAVAASSTAMNAVAASSTAMNAVIASDNAKNALLNNYNTLLANREALWDAAQKMQLKLSSNADTVSGLNTQIPANCIVFAALGTYDNGTHKGRARIKHRNGFYSSYFGSRVNVSTKTVTKSNFDVITFDGCTFEEEGDGFATVACFG